MQNFDDKIFLLNYCVAVSHCKVPAKVGFIFLCLCPLNGHGIYSLLCSDLNGNPECIFFFQVSVFCKAFAIILM